MTDTTHGKAPELGDGTDATVDPTQDVEATDSDAVTRTGDGGGARTEETPDVMGGTGGDQAGGAG